MEDGPPHRKLCMELLIHIIHTMWQTDKPTEKHSLRRSTEVVISVKCWHAIVLSSPGCLKCDSLQHLYWHWANQSEEFGSSNVISATKMVTTVRADARALILIIRLRFGFWMYFCPDKLTIGSYENIFISVFNSWRWAWRGGVLVPFWHIRGPGRSGLVRKYWGWRSAIRFMLRTTGRLDIMTPGNHALNIMAAVDTAGRFW